MKYSELKRSLKNHNLRITDCRMDVLELFQNANHALSFKDLEESLTSYDRVTLYRTIYSFEEKGLLHSIPNDTGVMVYGLCQGHCTSQAHNDDHVHFKCQKCGSIECLPAYHVPKINIPGYDIHHSDLIINGICTSCN